MTHAEALNTMYREDDIETTRCPGILTSHGTFRGWTVSVGEGPKVPIELLVCSACGARLSLADRVIINAHPAVPSVYSPLGILAS